MVIWEVDWILHPQHVFQYFIVWNYFYSVFSDYSNDSFHLFVLLLKSLEIKSNWNTIFLGTATIFNLQQFSSSLLFAFIFVPLSMFFQSTIVISIIFFITVKLR